MKELAGVRHSGPAKSIAEDDLDTMGVDDFGGDDFGDDDFAVADDFDDSMGDMDTGFDAGMGDELGGNPGDIGPSDDLGMDGMDDMGMGDDLGMDDGMGMEPSPLALGSPAMPGSRGVAPVDSSAYTEIQDHLNNIQDLLGDVKLSEYRSLISKLDSLTVQIRSMGRDYLGEARKRK